MKKILLFLSFISVGFVNAQNQTLSIDDAILKGRTILAPERLSQLMWKPDNKTMSYVGKLNGKEVLIYINTPNLNRDTVLKVEDLYASFYGILPEESKFERFPFFTWYDNASIIYNYNNAVLLYNFETKKTTIKAKASGSAENLDFEKIKSNPAISIIGYMTDEAEGKHLITRGGNKHELIAQGWNHAIK